MYEAKNGHFGFAVLNDSIPPAPQFFMRVSLTGTSCRPAADIDDCNICRSRIYDHCPLGIHIRRPIYCNY